MWKVNCKGLKNALLDGGLADLRFVNPFVNDSEGFFPSWSALNSREEFLWTITWNNVCKFETVPLQKTRATYRRVKQFSFHDCVHYEMRVKRFSAAPEFARLFCASRRWKRLIEVMLGMSSSRLAFSTLSTKTSLATSWVTGEGNESAVNAHHKWWCLLSFQFSSFRWICLTSFHLSDRVRDGIKVVSVWDVVWVK